MFGKKKIEVAPETETTTIGDCITNTYNNTMDNLDYIVEEKISKGINESVNELIDEKDTLVTLKNQIKKAKDELEDIRSKKRILITEFNIEKEMMLNEIDANNRYNDDLVELRLQRIKMEAEEKFNKEKIKLIEEHKNEIKTIYENIINK